MKRSTVRQALVGATVVSAVVTMTGCTGSLTDSAPAVSDAAVGQGPQPGFEQCPWPDFGNNGSIVCAWGINNAKVFTAPGVLGDSVFTKSAGSPSQAYNAYMDFPKTWSGPSLAPNINCRGDGDGVEWCAMFGSDDTNTDEGEASASGIYVPPTPFPPSDTVEIQVDSSGGPRCNDGQTMYTECTVVFHSEATHGSGDNTVFQLDNFPLTIAIYNNLGTNTLSLGNSGLQSTGDIIVDQLGTNLGSGSNQSPNVVPNGVGYIGAFLPSYDSTPAVPSISADFVAQPDPNNPSDPVGGTTFSLTVNFAASANFEQLQPQPACKITQNSYSSVFCDYTVIGQPGGPQTILISMLT